jgi:SAM-dependent methyltransferase
MDRSPAAADAPHVRQLAEAMRAGLERRHWPGAPPVNSPAAGPMPSESGATLLQYADLLHFPAVARPGPFHRLIRFLRGTVRPLIRPWLAVQTEFNRHTLQTLQGVYRELGLLRARIEELQEQVDGRAPTIEAPAVAAGFPDVAAPECILERIFVHTRLPPPPARVLVLGGGAGGGALELASFGYAVVGVGRQLPVLHHPSLAMVGADARQLPLASAGFDVVVGLFTGERAGVSERAVAEIGRVLRRGGRLLLTLPVSPPTAIGFGMHDLLRSFRPVETLYGIRDGEIWSITPDGATAGCTWAVALIVAENP